MQIKLPFNIKIISLDYHETFFSGRIKFHEKPYNLKINHNTNEKTIKLPFDVIGVKNQNTLVRISADNGIYEEEHLKFIGKSKSMIIKSSDIFEEIMNKHAGLKTIEVFFK